MRTLFVSLLFVALPPLTAFAQDVCSAGNMSGTFTTDVTRTVAAGDWTVTLTGVGGNGHGRFSERGGSGATVRASYRIPGGTSLAFFIGEGGSGSADGAGGTGIVANGATLLMIAGGGGGAGDSNDGRGGLIDMTGPGGGNGGGSSGGGGGGGFGAGNAGTNSFNNSGAGGNAATLTSKGAGVAGSGAGFGAGGSGSQGGGGGGGYQGGNGGGIFQAGRGGTSFVETASFSGVFDLVNSSDGETGGGTTGAGADGSVQFDCSPYAPPITVTSTTPINGAASIARVSNVTATFSATISNASADATSFVVRGRQSGRRTGSVTVSGSTVTFDPTHDFFPGERIHVTPTSALSGTAGGRVVPQTGTFTAATAQGGGTFTQSTFGSDLQVITPIDYDRDGDIDIIAKASSTVELYQNNGSGSFSASSLFNLTNGSATPVDFDGDGDFDFVAGATTTGSVDWYENDGGTISYADDLVSSPLRDAFVTDLDADGMMDVVVATSAGVKYVRNQGGQMFGVIDVGSGTFDIDGVDVDGDGDLDFVANGSNTLNVLLNDGDAVSFTSQSIDPQSAEDPQFADVDGDGDFDIVSGLSGPNSIVWYANDGNGNFGTSQSIGTGPVANLRYVEPVDVDGDGHLDVVAAFMGSTSSATGQVVWYKNDGNQTFTQQVLATNLDRPQYAHAADFTGDGILDVIVLPTNTGSPILFTQGASANPEINVTGNGTSIASGDTTPDASDGTDFGSTAIDGGTVSRTFTIANTGTGTLTLGANAVTLTGLNRADFTVTSQPSTTVAASGSATFTVEFDPAAVVAGQRTATVVIANDDADEAPYTFQVHGLGTGEASGFTGRFGGNSPLNGLDVGVRSTPALGDLDGDGDLDLLSGESNNIFNYYENTGSASSPVFTERTGALNPLNGQILGFDTAPALGDLDGDGDLDVLAGDVNGAFAYFENTGSASSPVFTRRTGAANPLNGQDVGTNSTPTFVDLDGDGDLDVLAGESDAVFTYYENTGSASSPVFTERTGASNPLDGQDLGSNSTLAFSDLDGDGDLDLVAGNSTGTFIYYENTGSASSPVFTARTGVANPLDGEDVGAASKPAFGDLDGDGDLDLLSGEFDGVFTYYENTGPAAPEINVTGNGTGIASGDTTPDASDHTDFGSTAIDGGTVSRTFTIANTGAGTLTLGAGAVTLTGLNRADFTVTSQPSTTVAASGSATFTVEFDPAAVVAGQRTATVVIANDDADESPYTFQVHGLGTGEAAGFTARAGAANPLNGQDLGGDSAPALGDLDGDGDLDLLAGEQDGVFNYYENTGSASSPVFTARTGVANPLDGEGVISRSTPTFGDLDGDGDLDVLTGRNDGRFVYYENTGSASAPVFTRHTATEAANPLNGQDVGLNSAPALGDLDGDGDLDLVVGEQPGTFTYYENTGSASSPVFTKRTGAGNPLDGEDVGSRSTPAFGDFDGDGDLDLVSGENAGVFNYYENTGTAASPVYTPRTGIDNPLNSEDVGFNSTPAFGDLYGDGDLDLVAGEINGEFLYYENTGPALPEINVTGNGTSIASGDTTPDASDHTDFGSTAIDGGTVSRTFTIQNTGTSTLTLGAGAVTLTGLNRADFTVTSQPATTVAASGSATFTVEFDPAAVVAGQRTATVVIANDDADEAPYTFQLHGLGTGEAAGFTERTGAANPLDGEDVGLRSTLALGDLGGDGDLDLVVGSTAGTFRYYENTGSASSPAFTERTGVSNPLDGQDLGFDTAPTLGDLDGDGDLDLLAGEQLGTFVYYENTGSSLSPAFTMRTGADNPLDGQDVGGRSTPALGDLDGDGDLDLLAGNSTGTFNYFENTGSASSPVFTARTGVANPLNGQDVGSLSTPTFGDLDGDGDLDLLAGESIGTFLYYENIGSASSPTFTQRTGGANPLSSEDVGLVPTPAFGDLDGDGDLDLVAGENDGVFNYYENTGVPPFLLTNAAPANGTFTAARSANVTATFDAAPTQASVTTTTFAVRGSQTGTRTGTATVSGQGVTFDPSSDFLPGEVVTVTASSQIQNAAGTSLMPYSWQFSAAPDAGPGTFGNPQVVTSSADGAFSVYAADVDGDGDLDLLSASRSDDTIAWYENDGSQGFTRQVVTNSADGARSVYAADVDGDGDLDLLSASANDNTIAWYENDGAAAPSFTQRVVTTSAAIARSVYAADVDGDGDLDILSASESDDTIAWYENDGSQGFTERMVTNSADGAFSVYAADVDGDGDLDLLSTSFFDDTIAWYENDGSQGFTRQVVTNSADGARSVYAADVDGDGDLDLLSASAGDNTIAWYENDGAADPSFTQRVVTSSADNAQSVYATDVDGDGDLDLLSASSGDNTVAWYENDGSQGFTRRVVTTGAAIARSVYAADVDGDGDLDILSASDGDDTIAWYEQALPTATISGDAGWRMLSAPAATFTPSDLADDTAIQGITGGNNPSEAPNLYTRPSTEAWTAPASISTAFTPGLGFILYFYDNTLQGSQELPLTLDADGLPPTADVTTTVANGGFTLLGNPYAQAIALDQLSGNGTGGTGTGLVSPIQVWDDGTGTPDGNTQASTTGSFQTFNLGENQIIAPWQGFMLQSADATEATIPLAARSGSTPTIEILSRPVEDSLAVPDDEPAFRRIAFELAGPEDSGALDASAQLYFHAEASTGRDGYDGRKLVPLLGAYATLAFGAPDGSDELLVQDARSLHPVEVERYDLAVSIAGLSGSFTLRWPTWEAIPDGWRVSLRDRVTGDVVDLRESQQYVFESAATTASASKLGAGLRMRAQTASEAERRFELVVVSDAVLTSVGDVFEVPDRVALLPSYPNPFNPSTTLGFALPVSARAEVSVYNALGQHVAVVADGVYGAGRHEVVWEAMGLPSGVYVVRLAVGDQVQTRTVTLLK